MAKSVVYLDDTKRLRSISCHSGIDPTGHEFGRAAVIGDVRTRLEGAAEKVRAESGLAPFFRKGSTKLGLDAVKGVGSRMAGGAVTGAIRAGPAGAIAGAAVGGISSAGFDFLWSLATRSFDKNLK